MSEKKSNSIQDLMDELAIDIAALSELLEGTDIERSDAQELDELEERIIHSLELGSPESVQYAEDFFRELEELLDSALPTEPKKASPY